MQPYDQEPISQRGNVSGERSVPSFSCAGQPNQAASHFYIHEKRISDLERSAEKHDAWLARIEERLARGEVNFTELRKDLEKLTEELRGIRSTLTTLGTVIVIGVLGVAGSALLWVISQMGGKT